MNLNNASLKPMIKILKFAATITVVFVGLYYTGILNGTSISADEEVSKGGKAFDYNFKLKDLHGNDFDVEKLKGKVVFLNMWATWCGPCRAEMPSIQELYNKVDHDKIEFVMLSLDTEENTQKVKTYVKDKNFTFNVYQPAGSLPKQLQVSSIPTTFVVGEDGLIKLKKVGTADYNTEDFKQFLESLELP